MTDVKSRRVFCCLVAWCDMLPLHWLVLVASGRQWRFFPILEPVGATNQHPA